jgi:hypothetical protein
LLEVRLPERSPAEREVHATVSVTVVRALLPVAMAADPDRRAGILSELKTLLVVYARALDEREPN